TLAAEMGATVAATVPFVTSSVTPTPKRQGGGLGDSITGPNLRTQLAFERSSMPPPHVLTVAVATTIIADVTFAPASRADTGQVPPSILEILPLQARPTKILQALLILLNVTNDSGLDDPDICRGVIDHLAHPTLFLQLRSMDYEQLFTEFNVGMVRQSCLGFEVRLWLEHELRVLKGQFAALESADVVKNTELESSNAQIAKLTQDLLNLQLSCDELSIKIEAVQDVQVKALSDRVVELDANLIGMALHLDEKLYPCYLTTIAGRRANRSLGEGIKARLDKKSKDWIEEIPHILWAHNTMIKSSNEDTPFSLTCETEAVIPAEIGMHASRTAEIDIVQNNKALKINLDLLEERREQAAIRKARSKAKMEKYYNFKVRNTSFKPGDLVYRNNDANHAKDSGKLIPKWEGPY
nr:reverse transcriptase domain-containing protein [Tanacetum cinerariifolium]